MMNMDRFQPPTAAEETPFWKEQLLAEYIVPEPDSEEETEEPAPFMPNSLFIRYLPSIAVFLACERRLDRRIVSLAEDGFFPGLRRTNTANVKDLVETYAPATHTEELEVYVDHVWAYADTADKALRLAALRRGDPVKE